MDSPHIFPSGAHIIPVAPFSRPERWFQWTDTGDFRPFNRLFNGTYDTSAMPHCYEIKVEVLTTFLRWRWTHYLVRPEFNPSPNRVDYPCQAPEYDDYPVPMRLVAEYVDIVGEEEIWFQFLFPALLPPFLYSDIVKIPVQPEGGSDARPINLVSQILRILAFPRDVVSLVSFFPRNKAYYDSWEGNKL